MVAGPIDSAQCNKRCGVHFGVFAVGDRHVFDHRGVLSPLRRADVTGDPLALMETFHRAHGHTHVHLRFDQPIRHRVIMPIDFNVIIDMNPRLFPFGEFVRDAGQRAQRGLLLGHKQGLPRVRLFLEGALVQPGQQFANGLVEFRQGEALPMA